MSLTDYASAEANKQKNKKTKISFKIYPIVTFLVAKCGTRTDKCKCRGECISTSLACKRYTHTEGTTLLSYYNSQSFYPFFSTTISKVMGVGSVTSCTKDGSVKALSQILYCQYHTWELFGSYMF
jgi:outer membrane protein W